MLQILDLRQYKETDIQPLIQKIQPILQKRQALHNRYSRSANASTVMYSNDNETTKLPYEKFITDLATGYSAGKLTYSVNASGDEEKNKIIKKLLDKEIKESDYAKSMQVLIEYITNYNDDNSENYDLIHDIFEMTSCYEVIYENEDNEIVYSKYSPLQTVATWDYNIPPNLTGLVRYWTETTLNGNQVDKVELTDSEGSRIFSVTNGTVLLEERNNHNWGDVPAFAVETDYSIFEPCEDLIAAYEQLVQNVRNTYQYNDTDCKLMFTNYRPLNPMIITDEKGNPIQNPARIAEDNAIMESRTMYTGEGGNVSWLVKPVDANGIEAVLKTYVDIMFQLAGIPNTADLAFNSADLNASAIDRKFYVMNAITEHAMSELKKAYLRRWELIFNRINLKKNTKFDFRDIVINIEKNLPSNNDEMANYLLKLRDLISDETIITQLGYDYYTEKAKKDEENADNMAQNLERMKLLGEENGSDTEKPMEENRSAFGEIPEGKQEAIQSGQR